MQILFRTKEESKKAQKDEFLSLSGSERFKRFLQLSRAINRVMPVKEKLPFEERYKDNFLLIHKDLKKE